MKQSLFENRHKAEWEQFSLLLEQTGTKQARLACRQFPK